MEKYIKALPFNQDLLDNFDDMCELIKRSGKHVKQCDNADKLKVVRELMSQKAFTFTPGRSYRTFNNCKNSLLADFDIADCYQWITTHKKQIANQKTVR